MRASIAIDSTPAVLRRVGVRWFVCAARGKIECLIAQHQLRPAGGKACAECSDDGDDDGRSIIVGRGESQCSFGLCRRFGTADTNSAEQRSAWPANLDLIQRRQPAIVVPGHMTPEAAADLSGVEHARRYLAVFEAELAKAKDSATLNAAMKARFPALGMAVALDIGAKVATGEMKSG